MGYIDEEICIEAQDEISGKRLDVALAGLYPEFTRSFLQRLIKEGRITLNNQTVKSGEKLRANDIIRVEIPAPEVLSVEPEQIPLDIYYEDAHLIVVNKPKGMVVHPAAGHTAGTLVNALLFHCKDSLSGVNGILRPGIVHRIDMDTTGLLVAAKSDKAHQGLAELFAAHDIDRVYTAICYGHFKEAEGTVNAPIARAKNDRKRMCIDLGGKRAVTHYKVLRELKYNLSLVECVLETGRTHQIRVHMASKNHGLLGDPVYKNGAGELPKAITGLLQGQTLHAGTLGFVHPVTGEHLKFTAPLPDYFQTLLTML